MPAQTAPSPTPPRVLVVGARSHRQGTGPFIASGLVNAGAEICGIVGTSEATVQQALAGLQTDHGISTRGYSSLQTALAAQRPDAVAICSPWRFHARQLQAVAAAGCHCLVEKPLAWPATENDVALLLAGFSEAGLLLQMVAQWPTTLAAFAQLHGTLPTAVDSFSMHLSPISLGPDMVTDAAPHFISMLQALLGNGEFSKVQLLGDTEADRGQLVLDARYHHAGGSCTARLLLETCATRPRPAWYQLNELRADREVELPEYLQHLVAGEHRVALPDPMQQVAAQFVHSLAQEATTDTDYLRTAHHNLRQLAAVWE